MFKLYDCVMIRESHIAGYVVAIDDDGGKRPPIYLVEKEDAEKTGTDDLVWLDEEEIVLKKW